MNVQEPGTRPSGNGSMKDPTKVSLSKEDRERLKQLRPLRNYRLQYVNKEFPILSFTYAVIAGGEYTLYCDHTEDYVKAYIGYDFETGQQDPSFRVTAAQRQALFNVLGRLERERDQGPLPTKEEWDAIAAALGGELKTAGELLPVPIW